MRNGALVALSCIMFVLLSSSQLNAQSEFSRPFGAAPVTANFIYKLIEYVSWPQPKKQTVICTIGDKDVAAMLFEINSDPEFKRNIKIQTDVNSFNRCHILYIGKKKRILPTLQATKSKPILTVSDIRSFAEKGGVVGFVYDDNSVSMQVNLKSLKKTGLVIDAELLALMEVVE